MCRFFLNVDLCWQFAGKSPESIEGESFKFILPGIDMHGGNETDEVEKPRYHIFRIGNAAGDEDGVDFPFEHRGEGCDAFGNLINHGIEHELGVVVAVFDAVDDFRYVGCSEMGGKPGFSAYPFFQLIFCVASGIAEVNQRA